MQQVQQLAGLQSLAAWLPIDHCVLPDSSLAGQPPALQIEGLRRELQQERSSTQRLKNEAQAAERQHASALAAAQRETQAAIHDGNRKYADMLAERLGAEDELRHQLIREKETVKRR